MPIFEFKCNECGEEFEELVLGTDAAVTCPKCGSAKAEQLISRCCFKSADGSAPSGGDDAPAPQYRGIGSGSGCAGCSGGNCSSCG